MKRRSNGTVWLAPFILFFLAIIPTLLSAQNKSRSSFEVKAGPLTINLRDESKTGISLVVSGATVPTPDIFTIESPNRLVFDFPMQAPAVTKSQTKRGPVGLRSVRVAGHSDKLRVVLDFGDAIIPSYTIAPSASPFTVQIGSATGAPAEPPTSLPTVSSAQATVVTVQRIEHTPTPQPTASAPPTSTETPRSKASAQPTALPTPLQTPTPTTTPAPTLTATPSPVATDVPIVATIQQLQALTFRQGGEFKTPTLVLSLSQRPTFKTSRKDDRTFRIVISDCKLARNSLSLPYYPPGDFPGVTMAIASPTGSSVEVVISVDRGWRITAVPRGNEILVTASDR